MPLRRWWSQDSGQRFWLEITQRPDLGADLNAPQFNYSGQPYWSYELVREVADGDVVFHYEMGARAIRFWSRAAGGYWPDEVFWGARGTVGRSSDPYERPGWRHGLDGPFPLAAPITLDDLRAVEDELQSVRDALMHATAGPSITPSSCLQGVRCGPRRAISSSSGGGC